MNNGKRRHDGGAYRLFTRNVSLLCKQGKDRTKARRKPKKEPSKNCKTCSNAVYVGEGGYICCITKELVLEGFRERQRAFLSCGGRDWAK